MSKVVTAKGKEFTFDDNVTDEQIGEALDEYFAGNTEDVDSEPLKKKEPTTQEFTTPLSPSALGLREAGSEVETSFASKGAEMQPVTPKVEGDRVRPTSQSMIEKIEGMTRKVKYPEYVGEKKQELFDFKKASADVRLEEEKKKQQEISIRAEERRRSNTSLRIDDLKEQRKSLVASYNKDDVKKLIEINALIDNLQEQQKAQEQTYYSFGKLNKSATKGVENELLSYLAKNPKIADEVQKRDLTEKETYSLVRNAVAEKTMPLAQDMKMFMEDGTYNLANEKYKVSKTLQEKQDKLEQSGEKLKNLQSEYLNKSGYSSLNSQYDAARKKVDALNPVEANINSQYKLYSSQIADIDKAMGAYSSKIKGETFYGTQDELNQYNNLVKDRKSISDKIESLINSDDAKAYDNAIKQLNSISSQINSITSNLKSGEIGKLKMDYELQLKDYNAALEQYKKFDEPKVKERLGQYYETVDKINSYDKKLAKVKGQFASISEIEEAQKKFDGTGVGGDVLSIAGRAANSILDASKKLVSSPFRIASSLSDAYGPGGIAKYHLSEYIADLIEGTGKEEMFMTKYSKPFYDAETDEINWGVVPFFNSIADNVGILTLFALTGRYGAAPYASAMTAEGATALEGQQVLKAAQTATTIAPAFMVSYGENYKDALKKGFDNSQAVIYSSTMSLLEGLSELIMPDQEILFGKGAKDVMLSRFIKDYAKGKKYAAYKLAEQFIENGIGEANEENVILLGNTISTTIGSLFNENVQAELPTLNNVITTDATAGALGSLMSLPSGLSEQSELYKTGIYKFAQDFETGNKFLTRLKEKGVIDEKKYNRLVTDVQKYQAVMGTVPDGLSLPKKIGIIEKLIEAKTLRSQMNDEKDNPINAINKKKIKILTEEIENIIDDKEYDKKFEESINTEAENAKQKMTTAPQVVLQKYATSTDEKYGYIDRGDGKGKVELTKEQFINEQRQYANQETKQQSGVDIQQPMGEGEGNIGTDGDISKQKQYEEEPVKEKDGEPMPGGVQGVRAEGEGGKESAELRPEEEALDTRNAKDIGDIQINDINSGNVVIGYHATPTGEIGTGKELGIHIGTEDVSNNIKKGRNADKGDVKKVAFRVNKPLILGDMPSWSSVNVLNEMMRLKLLGIDKEKIREIRDSDLSEKEKQQRVIELAKEKGYDSFAYQNFDEGNGEFSYVLFDDSKLNDITPKEAKATPQEGSVVGGENKKLALQNAEKIDKGNGSHVKNMSMQELKELASDMVANEKEYQDKFDDAQGIYNLIIERIEELEQSEYERKEANAKSKGDESMSDNYVSVLSENDFLNEHSERFFGKKTSELSAKQLAQAKQYTKDNFKGEGYYNEEMDDYVGSYEDALRSFWGESTPQAGSVVGGEVVKIEEEPLTNEEEKLAEEIKITKDDAKRAKKSNPKRTRKSKDIARVVESETKIAEDTKDARRAKGLIETIERTEEAILNNEPVDETFEQKHGVSEIAIVNELKEMGKQGDFYTAYQNLTGKEANIETEIDFLSSISAQGIKLRPKLSVLFTKENHIVKTKPLKKKPTKKTGIDSLQNIVGNDPIRPAMNGVYFDGKNMVATDAYKLIVLPKKESDAYIIEKLIDSNYKKTKKTVPTYTRDQATNYIKEQLKDGLNGKILDFNKGMVVDAVYPKYKEVIPDYKKGVKFDLQELIDTLNGARSVQENLSNNIFGISIRLGGEVSVFNPSLFMDLALSMQENGAKTVEVLNDGTTTKATLLKSDNGITGIMMPLAAKDEFPVSQVHDLSTKPTEAKSTEAKPTEAKPVEKTKPTEKAKASKGKPAAEPSPKEEVKPSIEQKIVETAKALEEIKDKKNIISKLNTFKLGKKREFYHASYRKREGRLVANSARQFGVAVYFSTNQDLVKEEFGENVTKALLTINNPVYTDDLMWDNIRRRAVELEDINYRKKRGIELQEDEDYYEYDPDDYDNLVDGETIDPQYVSDAAKEFGYDAIIDKDSNEYENEIAVLDDSKVIYEEELSNYISEAYHKAKADGSNPGLVKAVEELLGAPTEKAEPTISDDLNNFLKGDKGGLMQPDTDAMVKQFVEIKRKQGIDDNELRKGLEDAADKGIISREKIDEYMGFEKKTTFVPQEPKQYEDTGEQKRRPEQAGDRGGREESGKYTPLKDSPIIQGATGPDPNIVEIAEEYARSKGITLRRQAEYVPIDEAFATRIANAYEAMVHNPQDPKVKEAYQELIRQTREQYDALVKAGYEFTFYDDTTDPYGGNPYNAMRDLRQNKKMAVYGTYAGYGTEGKAEINIEDNPMMVDTGLKWKDQNGIERNVTANDLFRAVHDAFGHSIEGSGFRARGEENAWQAHARLYTGSAIAALTSETRGQNNWLNYGPYGEANRSAKVEETIFAPQKIGLMPEWTWKEGISPDMVEKPSSDRKLIEDAISKFYEVIDPRKMGSEKKILKEEMNDMLSKNPRIKHIFDNIKEINKQLEAKQLITKKGNCP